MADYDVEHGEKKVGRRPHSWSSRSPGTILHRSTTLSNGAAQTLESTEWVAKLTSQERQKQTDLISILIGDQLVKGSLEGPCVWYGRYLQSKFYHHWHLIAPALVGLEDNSANPASGDLTVVYSFVIEVAKLLKTRRNLALVEIVDELDNRQLLKQQMDEQRAILNQVVFATLGWLTMLYDAVPDPTVNKLQVIKTSTSMSGYRKPIATRKYCSYKQNFDYIDAPLFELLGRFGDLIPHSRPYFISELGSAPPTEVVSVKQVCFDTLQNLADIKIEWVTSLALHLEMDSSKKTLKLFQFPSFCRMMVVDRENHVLSRLLQDQASRLYEDVRAPEVLTEQFFKEILLTYRLIFGQDDRSHRAFSRNVQIREEQQHCDSSCANASWEATWACDPMLLTLCGRSATGDAEARKIYDEIDDCESSEPANLTCYNANLEFPFFGKRLLELQQFTNQHQPQNVRALLNDRRDVASWYALWNNQFLLVFATFTIILMVLSLILQAWQVILAKQQIQQFGQGPNYRPRL